MSSSALDGIYIFSPSQSRTLYAIYLFEDNENINIKSPVLQQCKDMLRCRPPDMHSQHVLSKFHAGNSAKNDKNFLVYLQLLVSFALCFVDNQPILIGVFKGPPIPGQGLVTSCQR